MRLAQLHEEIARDHLDRGDARGWTDWYAAVTVLGDAGRSDDAQTLISEGRQRAAGFVAMRQDIDHELTELESWLRAGPAAAAPGPSRPESASPTKG